MTRHGESKQQRLSSLVKQRGLATTGFMRALRSFLEEYVDDEDIDEVGSREEVVASEIEEMLVSKVVPAAYALRREGPDKFDATFDIYEIEGTKEIDDVKLDIYSWMADAAIVGVDLHIIDRYGHEIVVDHENLECFWSSFESASKWLFPYRKKAVARHRHSATYAKWKAAYDAVREMGVRI